MSTRPLAAERQPLACSRRIQALTFDSESVPGSSPSSSLANTWNSSDPVPSLRPQAASPAQLSSEGATCSSPVVLSLWPAFTMHICLPRSCIPESWQAESKGRTRRREPEARRDIYIGAGGRLSPIRRRHRFALPSLPRSSCRWFSIDLLGCWRRCSLPAGARLCASVRRPGHAATPPLRHARSRRYPCWLALVETAGALRGATGIGALRNGALRLIATLSANGPVACAGCRRRHRRDVHGMPRCWAAAGTRTRDESSSADDRAGARSSTYCIVIRRRDGTRDLLLVGIHRIHA